MNETNLFSSFSLGFLNFQSASINSRKIVGTTVEVNNLNIQHTASI